MFVFEVIKTDASLNLLSDFMRKVRWHVSAKFFSFIMTPY